MLTESVLFAVQAFLFGCGLASPAGLPPPLRCPAAASSSPSLSDLMPVPSRLPEPYLPIDIGVALRSVTSPSAGAINTGLQHFQFIGHGEVKPTTMLTESVLFAVQAFLFGCGLASPASLPPPLRCPATASSSPSLSDLMPVPSRLPEPYLPIDIGVALRSVTSPSAGAINTGLQHFQFIGHGEVKPTTMLTESVLFAVQGTPVKAGVWRVASPRTLSPAGGARTLGARCLVSSVTTGPSHVDHHTRTQGAPTFVGACAEFGLTCRTPNGASSASGSAMGHVALGEPTHVLSAQAKNMLPTTVTMSQNVRTAKGGYAEVVRRGPARPVTASTGTGTSPDDLRLSLKSPPKPTGAVPVAAGPKPRVDAG
ncbi:hypothetical protein ISCGN_009867 [Ixodes scapularis]